MIHVRLTTHWRIRRSEWMLSFCTIAVGLAYLLIGNLFVNNVTYFTTMIAIMPQRWWGALATLVGCFRVALLVINGAWRASPHLRALGAQLSCALWMALFVSSISAQAHPQTIGFWFLFFIFDAFSAVDAAGDARAADEKARASRIIPGAENAPGCA